MTILGTTLYSFTNEWVTGRYSLEGLLEVVADAGIGPGVELVGFQSIRGFPAVDPDFVRGFRRAVDRLGLVPTSLAANIDIAIRPDRDLSTDERVEYTVPQIEAAHALGFPVVRMQIGADSATLERLVPVAERLGIHLGMEIHAPDGPRSERVLAVREFYDRIDSESLGFIPDFSSTMHRITDGLVGTFVEAGLPVELVPDLQRIWADHGSQAQRLTRFLDLAGERGVAEEAAHTVAAAFTMNGHEDPAGWAELMPRVRHIHAKFYEIDQTGEEPSIDYAANLRPLRDAGFDGSISSEWEAHSWTPLSELRTAEIIRAHHDLMRRALELA